MSIAVQCPNCEKQYRVKDELRGKTVTCKMCKYKIVVGAMNTDEDEFLDIVDDVVSDESAKPEKPRSRSQSQTSRGKTTAQEKEKHSVRNMVLITIHLILLIGWLSFRLWRAYHPEPSRHLPTAEQQKLIEDVKESQKLLDQLERSGVLK